MKAMNNHKIHDHPRLQQKLRIEQSLAIVDREFAYLFERFTYLMDGDHILVMKEDYEYIKLNNN